MIVGFGHQAILGLIVVISEIDIGGWDTSTLLVKEFMYDCLLKIVKVGCYEGRLMSFPFRRCLVPRGSALNLGCSISPSIGAGTGMIIEIRIPPRVG
jgi:hypothetical protein